MEITLQEMQGGTFTISNLGSIGGTHFTPIVNKPEVAILGLGRGTLKPAVRSGKTQIRMMLPVCLSYDHRVIDGADGARFIQEIIDTFENFKEDFFRIPEGAKEGRTSKEKSMRKKN